MFHFIELIKRIPAFVTFVQELFLKYFNLGKDINFGMGIVVTYLFLLAGFVIWLGFFRLWMFLATRMDIDKFFGSHEKMNVTSGIYGPGIYAGALVVLLEAADFFFNLTKRDDLIEDKLTSALMSKLSEIAIFDRTTFIGDVLSWAVNIILNVLIVIILAYVVAALINLVYMVFYPITILKMMGKIDKTENFEGYSVEYRNYTIFAIFSHRIFQTKHNDGRRWIAFLLYPWFLPYVVFKDIRSLFFPSVIFRVFVPGYYDFIMKTFYKETKRDFNPIWPDRRYI